MKKLLSISALLLIIGCNTAFCATVTWAGTLSTNWNTPGNWSGGLLPLTGDIVNIGVSGSTITNQPTISATPLFVPSTINIGGGKAVTLIINSGITLTCATVNMASTSLNCLINVNGILTVTGNLTLGSVSRNTYNKVVLGTSGGLILGGTITGGTFDCGTGSGYIQLNGTVAQTFPAATPSTDFTANDIHFLHISNLVGVTLSGTFGQTSPYLFYNGVDALTVDDYCIFNANANLFEGNGTNYVDHIGYKSIYISRSTFNQHNNDVYDITSTLEFTAANQVVNLTAVATATNGLPNVIFTGTSISINGNPSNTVCIIRGNVSVTASSTIASYTNITALQINGNYNGTNSLASGTFPLTIGGSWNNTDTQPIAGIVNYVGNNIDSTQVVSTHAVYQNNVTFSGLSKKQLQTGTMQCAGANFDNSASSFVDCVTNSSTVLMNGAVDQTINGGTAANSQFPTDPVTGTIFYNLTIANTAATTPTVTLLGNNNIAPSGVLSVTKNGDIVDASAANSLTLMSTGTGTATIADLTAGGTINSTVIGTGINAQRFVTGGALKYRNYRFFSSPIYASSGVTLGSSTGSVYNMKYLYTSNTTYPVTTGNAGGGFDKSGNPTIYLYREDRNPNNGVFTGGNYIGIANITGTTLTYNTYNNTTTSGYLPVGNGYAFFYRGSKASLSGRTTLPITNPSYYPDNGTITSGGGLNQGTISVILWYNTTTVNSYQPTFSYTPTNLITLGFNLVGNPYASSIDWSKFSATTSTAAIYGPNLTPTVYELDPATNIFGTYNATTNAATNNGNKIISSGQGFFVKASTTGASLKFTEQAKSNTQLASGSSLLFNAYAGNTAYNQYIRLNLAKDTSSKSEILVGFNATSTKTYNEIEDDLYLTGLSATNQKMWATSSDNVKLVTKWMAYPSAKLQDTIKVAFTAAATGVYTFTKSELKGIPQIYDIWLMDKYKKDSIDIKNNATYAFNVDLADTNSFGSKRFILVIRQNPALAVHLLNFVAVKATGGAQTTWKTENEQYYTGFTLQRSVDGGASFASLDSLMSSSVGIYNFLDKNPLSTNQYRLKMTDLNGAVTYSTVVTLQYSTNSNNIVSNAISVYPNPSRGIINLAIKANTTTTTTTPANLGLLQTTSTTTTTALATAPASGSLSYNIKIVSVTGVVIKNVTSLSASWQDNLSNLPPGTYIIQVVNNNDKSVVGKSTFIKI